MHTTPIVDCLIIRSRVLCYVAVAKLDSHSATQNELRVTSINSQHSEETIFIAVTRARWAHDFGCCSDAVCTLPMILEYAARVSLDQAPKCFFKCTSHWPMGIGVVQVPEQYFFPWNNFIMISMSPGCFVRAVIVVWTAQSCQPVTRIPKVYGQIH